LDGRGKRRRGGGLVSALSCTPRMSFSSIWLPAANEGPLKLVLVPKETSEKGFVLQQRREREGE